MQEQDLAVDEFRPEDFKDSHTGEYRVKHPITGAPTSLVLILAGPEHPDRKKRFFDQQRRARAEMRATGQMPMDDPEEEDLADTDRIVGSVVGWRGRKVTYTAAAANELIAAPDRRWLRDQVAVALRKRELFIAASASA